MSTTTSTDEATEATGPLAGAHVLDLSRVLAGPYAAMILGDLGADVIKVEQPGSGDDTRLWGPPFIDTPSGPESTYFLSANRNKRSIEIDLRAPEERSLINRLLTWADVVIENFRPGVMDRLGLGDDVLESINPALVRLSISGFGDDGPESGRVGYDHILQAEGGLMSVTGTHAGPMLKVGVPIADITAALYGTIGILAALVERANSRRGQRVSTSLLAGQIALHAFQGTRYLVAGEVPPPSGNQHPTVCPYGVFAAGDAPIVIAVGNDAIWRRFAPLVGIDPARADFATNAARIAHQADLHELLAPRLAARDVAQWLALFDEAGVPAGQVKTIDQVYATEQVRQQGLVWSVEHTTLGPIELPGSPLRFARSPVSIRIAPPTRGEHSVQVRQEMLTGE